MYSAGPGGWLSFVAGSVARQPAETKGGEGRVSAYASPGFVVAWLVGWSVGSRRLTNDENRLQWENVALNLNRTLCCCCCFWNPGKSTIMIKENIMGLWSGDKGSAAIIIVDSFFFHFLRCVLKDSKLAPLARKCFFFLRF